MKTVPAVVVTLLAHLLSLPVHAESVSKFLVEIDPGSTTAQYLVDDAPVVPRSRTWRSPSDVHPLRVIGVQALPGDAGTATYAVILSDGVETAVATLSFDDMDDRASGEILAVCVPEDVQAYVAQMAATSTQLLQLQIAAFDRSFQDELVALAA